MNTCEPYYCPKCKQFGMAWDGRAKILMCYYTGCSHVIRIENQRETPSVDVIRAAIEADKNGESVGKSVRGVMKSDKQWDDPEFDTTDWAHPAWWRGTLYGVHHATRLVENIVSGKETGVGAMNDDADKLRQIVLGLVRNSNMLKRKADSFVGERNRLERERDGLVRDKDELRCDVEQLRLEVLRQDAINRRDDCG